MRKITVFMVLLSSLLISMSSQFALAAEPVHIKLATTTSVDDSGLLTYLLPKFEQKAGIKVDVLAVGTGKALKLAENGDVDLVLVHDPKAEEDFIGKGWGINRKLIMKNDFIIAGPKSDPAKVKAAKSAAEAFTAIKKNNATFISRGDESGTNKKELALWEAAGGKPEAKYYLETGQGMGATLIMASEKQAYALTDRGTFLAMKDKLKLTLLYEGGEDLINKYSVIAVNPERHKEAKFKESMTLIDWLVSPEGQKLIGEYKKDNTVLFQPAASEK